MAETLFDLEAPADPTAEAVAAIVRVRDSYLEDYDRAGMILDPEIRRDTQRLFSRIVDELDRAVVIARTGSDPGDASHSQATS